MKLTTFIKTIMAMSIMVLFFSESQAQCSTNIKKKCMPNIAPFTPNGQANTSTIVAGQKTEVSQTFYSGQDYRIFICSDANLGTCSFKVMDQSRKVLFDSQKNDSPDFWDFKSKSTQQLIVEVTTPTSQTTSSVLPSGCVTVLVGFKKDK